MRSGKAVSGRGGRLRQIRVQQHIFRRWSKLSTARGLVEHHRTPGKRGSPCTLAAPVHYPGLLRWGHHPLSSVPAAPVSSERASLRRSSIPVSFRERNRNPAAYPFRGTGRITSAGKPPGLLLPMTSDTRFWSTRTENRTGPGYGPGISRCRAVACPCKMYTNNNDI